MRWHNVHVERSLLSDWWFWDKLIDSTMQTITLSVIRSKLQTRFQSYYRCTGFSKFFTCTLSTRQIKLVLMLLFLPWWFYDQSIKSAIFMTLLILYSRETFCNMGNPQLQNFTKFYLIFINNTKHLSTCTSYIISTRLNPYPFGIIILKLLHWQNICHVPDFQK